MLRQKWAGYACEIIKDGLCVNQSVVKRTMEARNNYPSKKGTVKKSRDERQTKQTKIVIN